MNERLRNASQGKTTALVNFNVVLIILQKKWVTDLVQSFYKVTGTVYC